MKVTKNIVKNIEEILYENDIDLSEGNSFFLSHIRNDLFCLFTRKTNHGNFFSENSDASLNPFFSKFAHMMLSDELNLSGCFDYERSIKYEYKTVKDKANNYLSASLNFMLFKYSKKQLIPLSYFTYISGYIWNVCTNKEMRGKGYMTELFRHFLYLLKSGEFSEEIKLIDNNLSLNLLKSNPHFEETKKFYNENGFSTLHDMHDKIIMNLKC